MEAGAKEIDDMDDVIELPTIVVDPDNLQKLIAMLNRGQRGCYDTLIADLVARTFMCMFITGTGE